MSVCTVCARVSKTDISGAMLYNYCT